MAKKHGVKNITDAQKNALWEDMHAGTLDAGLLIEKHGLTANQVNNQMNRFFRSDGYRDMMARRARAELEREGLDGASVPKVSRSDFVAQVGEEVIAGFDLATAVARRMETIEMPQSILLDRNNGRTVTDIQAGIAANAAALEEEVVHYVKRAMHTPTSPTFASDAPSAVASAVHELNGEFISLPRPSAEDLSLNNVDGSEIVPDVVSHNDDTLAALEELAVQTADWIRIMEDRPTKTDVNEFVYNVVIQFVSFLGEMREA